MTFPVSGTGSAGMEAALVNLLEPGAEVVMCVNGYFGERMCEMATRIGAQPLRVACEWGGPVDRQSTARVAPFQGTCAMCSARGNVHWRAATAGALRDIVDERDGFLLIDAVTSIGAHALSVDRHRVDVCYAGSQKALSCPPGLAPITFSERAVAKMQTRQTPVRSWYFDTTPLMGYWGDTAGGGRAYHHTAPITMNYALHEALRLVAEEGLAARAQRHERHHRALVAGVEALGLQMQVVPAYQGAA